MGSTGHPGDCYGDSAEAVVLIGNDNVGSSERFELVGMSVSGSR